MFEYYFFWHCTVQEPLGEYVRLIISVKNALQQRQDKKADYLASLTDVEAKQIAHNKIALSPAKEDQACIKLVGNNFLFVCYKLSLTHAHTHVLPLSLIHSCIHPYTHPCTHSSLHLHMNLPDHSLMHTLIHSFPPSYTYTLMHTLIHSFTYSHTTSCTHSFTRSYTHTLTHSLNPPLFILHLKLFHFIFIILQALVYKAQAVAKETKTEYELVTRRVITEFEQFKSQKVVDMRDIMLNFVRMQVSQLLCLKV